MSAPKYQDISVPGEGLDADAQSLALSVVTQAMWKSGVPENDIQEFCDQLAASTDALATVQEWVTVTPART